MLNTLKKYFLVLTICLLGFFTSCSSDDQVDPNDPNEIEYELVWSDEFDGEGAVNSDNWFHQTQLPNGISWFNNELQHYTDREENSYLSNGTLKIVAKRESFTDQGQTKQYTSARLNSKFAFTYGRVDVRAQLPAGVGTWPAIWMLGRNINENGGYWDDEFGNTNWPAVGEIDIMEHWGDDPNVVHGSIHTTSSSGATINTGKTLVQDVFTTWHIYSMIWDENQIRFLVDEREYYTYAPQSKTDATWPFDEPQYFLLNVAISEVQAGQVSPSFTEATMEIDYIRVYQEKE